MENNTSIISVDGLTEGIARARMPELLDISRVCWTEIGEEPWTEENYLKELKNKWPLSCYAQTLAEGKLVGCVIGYERGDYGPVPDDGRDFGFVSKVVVYPEYRGNNAKTPDGTRAAEAMMRFFMKAGKELGYPVLRLGVLPHNKPAINFYLRLGFEVIGIRECPDRRERLVMAYFTAE
jgi:ribosomal protein S18 acetylase RimI-like enzyme